jgi:hypothetical protein
MKLFFLGKYEVFWALDKHLRHHREQVNTGGLLYKKSSSFSTCSQQKHSSIKGKLIYVLGSETKRTLFLR